MRTGSDFERLIKQMDDTSHNFLASKTIDDLEGFNNRGVAHYLDIFLRMHSHVLVLIDSLHNHRGLQEIDRFP